MNKSKPSTFVKLKVKKNASFTNSTENKEIDIETNKNKRKSKNSKNNNKTKILVNDIVLQYKDSIVDSVDSKFNNDFVADSPNFNVISNEVSNLDFSNSKALKIKLSSQILADSRKDSMILYNSKNNSANSNHLNSNYQNSKFFENNNNNKNNEIEEIVQPKSNIKEVISTRAKKKSKTKNYIYNKNPFKMKSEKAESSNIKSNKDKKEIKDEVKKTIGFEVEVKEKLKDKHSNRKSGKSIKDDNLSNANSNNKTAKIIETLTSVSGDLNINAIITTENIEVDENKAFKGSNTKSNKSKSIGNNKSKSPSKKSINKEVKIDKATVNQKIRTINITKNSKEPIKSINNADNKNSKTNKSINREEYLKKKANSCNCCVIV